MKLSVDRIRLRKEVHQQRKSMKKLRETIVFYKRKTAKLSITFTETSAISKEKIKTLAEGVDFSTEEEFREKVKTIRENYFPSEVKQADEETLNEKVETDADKKVVSNDPFVNAVSKAISQTKN